MYAAKRTIIAYDLFHTSAPEARCVRFSSILIPLPDLCIDWMRPPHPLYTADYATYHQILIYFFDLPSALCALSVHRMALVGKEFGKDVGQGFRLSATAGAIKCVYASTFAV